MKYDFDKIINRRGTCSQKHDFAADYGKPEDAIPLWVADMDFQTPPEVLEELQKSVQHGIFGYTETDDEYFFAIQGWFAKLHDYHIEKEWLVKTPGVVNALAMAVRAYTAPGDAILIQKPLYYPIERTILANGRVSIDSPLIYSGGKYSIDLADFEKKILENKCRMFVLCNPHNPVGRVWTQAELKAMGDICKKHNVLVFSDEIHCDLIFPGHKHLMFSTVCEDTPSVIATAPSKTFNLAGLQCSNIFISDKNLRDKFKKEIHASGYSQLNTLGLAACKAAYSHGAAWHSQLMEYLAANAAYIKDFLAEKIPQVHVVSLEGSYLLWLDFNALGKSHAQLEDIITNKAKLWLSSGTIFGEAGEGFFRLNLTSPRSVIQRAMEQLYAAMSSC